MIHFQAMLRSLAVTALFISVMSASPAPRQEQGHGTGEEKRVVQNDSSVSQVGTSTDAASRLDQAPPIGNRESGEKPLPRFVRPEWVIVYVTVVYAFFTWLTLRAIERQANLMEQQTTDNKESSAASAVTTNATLAAIQRQAESMEQQAALIREQMDTMVHRQRARLNITPRLIAINNTRVEGYLAISSAMGIRNSGHSNAFIKEGAAKLMLADTDQWPLPPAEVSEVEYCPSTFEPSKEATFIHISTNWLPLTIQELAEEMEAKPQTVFFYGYLEYETLGIRWHTDFGFMWHIDGEIGFFEHRTEKGMLEVSGGWDLDPRQKHGEYRV